FDCGVFALTFAEYLTEDRPLDFSQKDMPAMRRKVAYSLLEGRLLE
ncbi:unnamed protein product, partial [Phaeothamnion confervicola]